MKTLQHLSIACLLLPACYGGSSNEGGEDGASADDGGSGEDGDGDGDSDDDDDDDGPADVECNEDDFVYATPLRRLSQKEMANTLRALLGTDEPLEELLPPDTKVAGFSNNAYGTPMSPLLLDSHFRLLEELALTYTADPDAIGCGGLADDACVEALMDGFGRRAYRRPLSDAERTILTTLFEQAQADNDLTTSLGMVVQAMLLSPQFLYRIESGDERRALTDHELATRLAFLLWAEGPDDALLDLADDGALSDPDLRTEVVDTMLADARAAQAAEVFFEEWLGVDELHDVVRSEDAFPDWDPSLVDSMREETRRFVDHVALEEELDLSTLLTADFTFVDDDLAAHYGVSPPSEPWGRVDLDPDRRAGVLSHASLMTELGHENQTSPIHRGLFVRERVLCQNLPPPPPDLVISLPEVDPTMSTRERFARHANQEGCKECHSLIDPVGLAFEHYDATGAWRDFEGDDVPVSGAGRLDDVAGISPLFYGARGLADQLADNQGFHACMARQMFRFAQGREERPADACAIDAASATYQNSGRTYRALVEAQIESAMFLNREPEEGQ